MSKVAIVAAFEREIHPLVKHWRRFTLRREGWEFPAFQNDFADGNAFAIAAGMGTAAAQQAAEAILEESKATTLLSVGWAGALNPELKVGKVFIPAVVSDQGGEKFEIRGGNGALLTLSSVAAKEDKTRLRTATGADIVDMEAAAVAAVARQHGIEFIAVKAVSDTVDCLMPPVGRFQGPHGEFQKARFALFLLMHPQWWGPVRAMAKDSQRAANALCKVLYELIEKGFEKRD